MFTRIKKLFKKHGVCNPENYLEYPKTPRRISFTLLRKSAPKTITPIVARIVGCYSRVKSPELTFRVRSLGSQNGTCMW